MSRSGTIPWAKPSFWGNEERYAGEALASTWISGGPFVDRLEREFAEHCGSRYALSSSNGTTALHMAFLATGIRPGDEIIIPGFGFLAAANIALHMGATPVFAEVDPLTWCLSASEIGKCLSPRTKAIVPIHTYGNACDMDGILALAEDRGLVVVEDAAEALFSRYKGILVGTMGNIGSFSFQATKTITTGEGGMIATDHKDLYEKMCLYRNHGMLRKRYYWHELAGYNFRLTNMQAALGCAQLEATDQIIHERRRVHEQYRAHLCQEVGLETQHFPPEVDPVLWAIAVRLDPAAYPQGRDKVMEQLRGENIETRNGFYPPSLMGIYSCEAMPVCEEISRQTISLPTFATLRNDQIEYVCDRLKELRS